MGGVLILPAPAKGMVMTSCRRSVAVDATQADCTMGLPPKAAGAPTRRAADGTVAAPGTARSRLGNALARVGGGASGHTATEVSRTYHERVRKSEVTPRRTD